MKLSDASFSKSPAQLAGVNPVNASATCAASNAFAVSAAPDGNVKKLVLNIAVSRKAPWEATGLFCFIREPSAVKLFRVRKYSEAAHLTSFVDQERRVSGCQERIRQESPQPQIQTGLQD